jgi:hypothetical protein
MMKSKRFLMVMTLLLIAAGVNAQKIDQRLTRLIEKSDTRSMSAIATMKKGEEFSYIEADEMMSKINKGRKYVNK